MRNHSVIPFFLLLSFSAFAQQSIPDVSVAFGEQSSQDVSVAFGEQGSQKVSVAFGEQSSQGVSVAFGEQGSQGAPPSCAEQSFPDTSLSVRQHFVSVELDRPAFLAQPEVDLRQWQPYDPLTMGMQAVLGVAGGFVGGYAGLLVGVGAGRERSNGLEIALTGGYLGSVMLGVPLGVYIGGELMGGRGSYWGAMSGSAVGNLIGIAAMTLDGREDAGVPIAFGLAIISPIIGYHLSASQDSTETDAMRSELTRPPVHPVVTWPVDPVTPRPDFEMTLLSLPL